MCFQSWEHSDTDHGLRDPVAKGLGLYHGLSGSKMQRFSGQTPKDFYILAHHTPTMMTSVKKILHLVSILVDKNLKVYDYIYIIVELLSSIYNVTIMGVSDIVS